MDLVNRYPQVAGEPVAPTQAQNDIIDPYNLALMLRYP